MTLTIEIPEKVVKLAEKTGQPVEALVTQAIARIGEAPGPAGFVRIGQSGKKTPQEAAVSIRELASRNTLGGLKIKDLIDEGRRV